MTAKIGIDIGGVISDKLSDTPGAERDPEGFLRATPIDGAIEAIARLGHEGFETSRMFLVSKCGWNMQLKTRLWLRAINFYGRTGVPIDQVWFCLKRSDKAGICQTLGITHFVDDRLEILGQLRTVRHKFLFRPNPSEVMRYVNSLPLVTRVENWNDAEQAIEATL